MSKIRFSMSSNSPRDRGQLISHKTTTKGIKFEVPTLLHVDYTALMFSSRGDPETSVSAPFNVFKLIGLETRLGW